MTAYYNEFDPFCAEWLRNLIDEGLIAAGVVDTRSIEDVTPNDLRGFTQCHFFAGIGIWSYALRRAGWSDDREVWTGSCPCQPFSAAGKGKGFADERHLWPAWHHLLRVRRPSVVFGEQVESPDGLAWLDLVQADMEGVAYALGAVSSPSAGYGAPHGRPRIYFVADTDHPERRAEEPRWNLCDGPAPGWLESDRHARERGRSGALVDAGGRGREVALQQRRDRLAEIGRHQEATAAGDAGPLNGIWRDAEWLWHRDDKWRAVEAGTFPLAHGDQSTMGRLRAYGNAINAEQATAFVEAYLDARADPAWDL